MVEEEHGGRCYRREEGWKKNTKTDDAGEKNGERKIYRRGTADEEDGRRKAREQVS